MKLDIKLNGPLSLEHHKTLIMCMQSVYLYLYNIRHNHITDAELSRNYRVFYIAFLKLYGNVFIGSI